MLSLEMDQVSVTSVGKNRLYAHNRLEYGLGTSISPRLSRQGHCAPEVAESDIGVGEPRADDSTYPEVL